MLVAALVVAVAAVGCGSGDSDSGDAAGSSTTAPAPAPESTTVTSDDREDAGSPGAQALGAALSSGLPALTDDEATCVAGVILDSLGRYSEVITGSNPVMVPRVAELTKQLADKGEATSVEENAAAVAKCVPAPVSFSKSPTPPTGAVATCANEKLSAAAEYRTYLGEFRFLSTYYDRAGGSLKNDGGGVEVHPPTSSLLVGACPG